jgi:hypothetical protein
MLWKTKIHNRNYKRPSSLSILSQINKSMLPHPTSSRSIVILSLYLRLVFRSAFFLQVFPPSTLYTPFFTPIRATCPAYLILLHLNTRIIQQLVTPGQHITAARHKQIQYRQRKRDVTSRLYETGRYYENHGIFIVLNGFHEPCISFTEKSHSARLLITVYLLHHSTPYQCVMCDNSQHMCVCCAYSAVTSVGDVRCRSKVTGPVHVICYDTALRMIKVSTFQSTGHTLAVGDWFKISIKLDTFRTFFRLLSYFAEIRGFRRWLVLWSA